MADVTRDILLQPMPTPGGWAVGVSSGADSVALLRLLCERPELRLHLVHLDHQIRGESSRLDSVFAAELAAKLNLPATLELRENLESKLSGLPKNRSARFRAIRMELFRGVVQREKLQGVILAHHADDQAETIFLRLLRGSGAAGLVGMGGQVRINGLVVLRPLLGIRRDQLREYLATIGQDWREDESNQSDKYLRNRVRRWLIDRPGIFPLVLELGKACGNYSKWARKAAPILPEEFAVKQLAQIPSPLARESARRWLVDRGASPGELNSEVLQRLCEMASDAATPAKQQFPGPVTVRRTAGRISVESSS